MKLAALIFAGVLAHAEVLDSSATGFTVRTTLTINAAPDVVYKAFLGKVAEWWNPAHTFSRDARNLSIDERPGGCFCEKLPNGGFTRHMEVINLTPPKRIVMTGALGPMQPLAAIGTMQIQFTAVDGGTKFEATYSVSGYLAKGMNTWAAPADGMTAEQFTRLKSYVETGKPSK